MPFPDRRHTRLRFALVQAFFDDSGDFRSPGLSYLAGWISDTEGWNRLGAQWQLLLAKHRLEFLHTSDFLAGEGDHRDSTLTAMERRAVVRQFVELIRDHVFCGYAIGIDPVAYQAALPTNEKGKRGYVAPDEFCLLRTLRWVQDHTAAWHAGDFLECAFDESDKNAGRFLIVWRRLKQRRDLKRKLFTSILFGDDKIIPMLQAADLLGVATQKLIARELHEDDPFARIFTDEMDHPVFGNLVHFELWDEARIANEPWLKRHASSSSGEEAQP